MKNLKDYGVLELDAKEIRKTDGGLLWALFAYLAWETLGNPSASNAAARAGWGAGYNYNQ